MLFVFMLFNFMRIEAYAHLIFGKKQLRVTISVLMFLCLPIGTYQWIKKKTVTTYLHTYSQREKEERIKHYIYNTNGLLA